jgi:hypothetical protein
MDEMREIVTMDQLNRLFLILAVAAPVIGAGIGGVLGAKKGNAGKGAGTGLLVGLLGPANLVLWKVYNVITDRMGLDTVKNLFVQLGLFVALGVAAGLIASYMRRPNSNGANGTAPALVPAGGPDPGQAPGARRTSDEAGESPRDARTAI